MHGSSGSHGNGALPFLKGLVSDHNRLDTFYGWYGQLPIAVLNPIFSGRKEDLLFQSSM